MAFFFLSQVLGRPLTNEQGQRVGRIRDLVARLEHDSPVDISRETYPPLTGLVVRIERQDVFVPWSQVRSLNAHGGRLASARIDLRRFERREGEVLLRRDVLDRQLIDVDGRRVIRANDLQLYMMGDDVRVVAVDVSGEALVRRFTWGRLFATVSSDARPPEEAGPPVRRRRLGPIELIKWPDIEPLSSASPGVRLRLSHDRLALLHPVDLAHIVDGLSYVRGAEILESLDDETAADALQEMDEERQADLVETMDQDRVADILEEMAPDDAADLLADLDEEQARDLLRRMDREDAEDVEELLRYPENSAGGIMTSEFVTVPSSFTVDDAITFMRGLDDAPPLIEYLYLVEEREPGTDWAHVAGEEGGALFGIVALRDLLLAPADRRLSDIMTSDFVWVGPEAPIARAAHLIAEYNLMALPVLDDKDRIIGIITVDDVMEVLLPARQRRALPRIFR